MQVPTACCFAMLQVCDIVLGDKTVDRDTRRRRAEALRDLSNIFQVNRRLSIVHSMFLLLLLDTFAARLGSLASQPETQVRYPGWLQSVKRRDWSGLNVPGVSGESAKKGAGLFGSAQAQQVLLSGIMVLTVLKHVWRQA
jgi:hypothetical protein